MQDFIQGETAKVNYQLGYRLGYLAEKYAKSFTQAPLAVWTARYAGMTGLARETRPGSFEVAFRVDGAQDAQILARSQTDLTLGQQVAESAWKDGLSSIQAEVQVVEHTEARRQAMAAQGDLVAMVCSPDWMPNIAYHAKE